VLLAANDFFAATLVLLHREEAELIEQLGGEPRLVGELLCVVREFTTEQGEQRALE
jgi:hypothetical protein